MTEQHCPLCGAPVADDAVECPNCHTNLLLARHLLSLEARMDRMEQRLSESVIIKSAENAAPRAQTAQIAPKKQATTWQPRKAPKPAKIKPKAPAGPNPLLQSDFWLNKIGIGLIFLALVFLFNYAVEQGWLTPWIRIAIGFLTGVILLGLGQRLSKKHRHFSQVLAGGGIAIEYLTGFAALQLYQLVPFWLAMLFMSGVTLLAFALAMQQDEVTYAIIGVVGGLATPYLLDVSRLDDRILLAYTSLILLLAGLIYLRRGWQLLLWTAAAIQGLILIVTVGDISRADRWVMQASIVLALLVSWALPVWREVLHRARRWPATRFGFADSFIPSGLQALLNADVYFITVFAPAVAFLLTIVTWDLHKTKAGWIALAGVVIMALIAYALSRTEARRRLFIMHGWVSALLLIFAIVALVDNDFVLLALALLAATLQILARHWHFQLPEKIGVYALWLFVGFGAIARLTDGQHGLPLFNLDALIDLAVIILLVVAFMRKSQERIIFWLAAHIFFLMWLARELGAIQNGQALVSGAWGLYALILLGISLARHNRYLRWTGLGTLFLLTAKLFLVDLAEVRAIWRVLLFAGVGILFLIISFFYQRVFSDDDPEPEEKVITEQTSEQQ